MKRLFVFALLLGLLLCGCEEAEPTQATTTAPTQAQTQPVTETTAPTQTTTEPATQPATEPTQPATEPTQPVAEKVTVYLLQKTVYFDSGFAQYKYDKNHNVEAYQLYTIENDLMYEVCFDEQDANGMPCLRSTIWSDSEGDKYSLTYFADGKRKEEQLVGSNFSGVQYEYDNVGNLIEKRSYYEGILDSAVYYEYDGETLTAAFCEDISGNRIFECKVENGRIVEKNFLGDDSAFSYRYEYDENGNLAASAFLENGQQIGGDIYSYQAVEVDADRANYLIEQQKQLINIA